MESIISNENKAFYNLRKREGSEQARQIMAYWYHFHIDDPGNADEALYYYIFGGKA